MRSGPGFRYSDDVLRKLTIDDEHFRARWLASLLKRRRIANEDAVEILVLLTHSPRLRKLLDEALKGKPLRSDLSALGIKIVRAWQSAADRCGMYHYGDREIVVNGKVKPPTLHQVKLEYARLFIRERRPQNKTVRGWLLNLQEQNKVPRDASFKKTLARCGCEFRLEKGGFGLTSLS